MKELKYIQIYNNIKKDILNNKIKANQQLPSKRDLAKNLNVSINTIINAYNLLLEEGLIISKEKCGYFVIDHAINTKQSYKSTIENKKKSYTYDFTTKNIDYNAFPFYTWAKISKNILYNSLEVFEKTENKGHIKLRNTIADHLFKSKGIETSPNNIIIGSGIEYLLTILISILNYDTYYIENPGYAKIKKILENNNKIVKYLNIDELGAQSKNIDCKSIIYLTPQNQFPTGIKMQLNRKLDIIKKIQQYDGYIIEDDFDSEFKYLKTKETSFYTLNNKTIFLSTFSRSISPSFRIAYMILPDNLLKIYEQNYKTYSSTVSTIDQFVLNEFIEGGYFSRHINKTKNLYKNKRDLIISKLNNLDFIKMDKINSLLSLNIEVNINKEKFKTLCQKENIDINLLDNFYFDKTLTNKIIIGYSNIDINILNKAIDILIKIIEESL